MRDKNNSLVQRLNHKTLTHENPTHRLIRRGYFQNVGSSGDRKNSTRAQKRFSSPRLAQKLDDRRIKSSPNLTKIYRHNHKGLVNMSTEGIDELLHGLGEVGEIRSKIGVFSRTQKLRFVVTRDFGGFSTRLDDFESLQRVTKTSRIKPSTRAHESTKENQNSIKRGTR